MRTKIALGLEYDGRRYFGFQRQTTLPSVQACLERALSRIANESVTVRCAGRTDVGVHAMHQVVHFETHARRGSAAWTAGTNAQLPPSIAVKWAATVRLDFHARFSALSRTYRYVIDNTPTRPGVFHRYLFHVPRRLHRRRMQSAADLLLGTHDFACFGGKQRLPRHSSRRTVHALRIVRRHNCLTIDVEANAFLHRMVRSIVGCLIRVGLQKNEVTWMSELIETEKSACLPCSAKAHGLYLIGVRYPPCFSLPSSLSCGSSFVQTS